MAARKLDPSDLPDIPVGLDGARSRDPAPIEGKLPPLPARSLEPRTQTAEAAPKTAAKRSVALRKKAAGGIGRGLLVLSLVGLCSFSVTAAATAAIVLGSLDVKAGWIKDKLSGVKSLVQQLR